jgi:DNA-binding MarR family transcriptional regulator
MDNVINLLQAYKSYLACGFKDDMAHFGKWLQQKENEQNNKPSEWHKRVSIDQAGLDGIIGYQLGGLMSYTETWTKLAFRDLPLLGLPDFGILKFVEIKGDPSKKEIAQKSIMEASTCFEIIKRLIKNELIIDHTDQEDKRIRRVVLTDYGKEILEKATKQVMQLSKFLLGDLQKEEKEVMLNVLKRLNDFHYQWYHEGSRDKLTEIYDL